MIKTAVKFLTPPILLELTRSVLRKHRPTVQTEDELIRGGNNLENKLEYIDFWGNTSLFALEVLHRHGTLLSFDNWLALSLLR